MACTKCGGRLYRTITNVHAGLAVAPAEKEANGNVRALICRKCGYIELYHA